MTTSFLNGPILPLDGTPLTLFTNALVIPSDTVDLGPAAPPRFRLTNIGRLIVTIEFDPPDVAGCDAVFSWLRPLGAFASVHQALRRYRDYRGYSVVYSGNRSLHFHFVFDTKHLEAVPWDQGHEQRLANAATHSAVMNHAHHRYWDEAAARMQTLSPPVMPDPAMRSATQWRRLPWGVRRHDKVSTVMGFAEGQEVSQMVVAENIRERAPKGALEWLVPPDFTVAHPVAASHIPNAQRPCRLAINDDEALLALQEACRDEWGCEYPKPVRIAGARGEIAINFQNSPTDENPSTVVRGDHRRLLVAGRDSFDRDFFLPDGMNANEWAAYLDQTPGTPPVAPPLASSSFPFLEAYAASIAKRWAEPRVNSTLATAIAGKRLAMRSAVGAARAMADTNYLIIGTEGSGKTTAHLEFLAHEALDLALESYTGDPVRFCAIASRSHEQAQRKAEEVKAATGRKVATIRSFWDAYRAACLHCGETPIPRQDFHSSELRDVLRQIREEHHHVYDELEEMRRRLWCHAPFDAGNTLLCTTHSMVQYWDVSRTTRPWYHPAFDPNDDGQDLERLRYGFAISRIVYDEIEREDLVHVLNEPLFAFVKREQERLPNWRNMRRPHREAIYREHLDRDLPIPTSFDTFDELMRYDLSRMQAIAVDFDRLPYGNDNTASGLYRRQHGALYYVGEREWLKRNRAHIAFLTTERLAAYLVKKVVGRRLLVLELDQPVPGIHPVRVPVRVDNRARARDVNELVRATLTIDPTAIVIADGTRNIAQAISFRAMKGRNDLQGRNIVVIPTMLASTPYSELNVLSQFLDLPNIISMHFQDQLNQAVGRNQGFRQGSGSVAIITNQRSWSHLKMLEGANSRVLLYRERDPPGR